MYRVLTEQRGATVDRRAAPRRAERLRHRRRRRSGPRPPTRPSSGCAARTTRRRCRSRTARSRRCSPVSPRTPPATAATRPIVVLDEAYAEFVDRSLVGLRERYPNLIVVRTASKAYAPRRAAGRLRDRAAGGHRPAEPVPAAGIGLDRVGHGRHGGPARPEAAAANIARVDRERERLRDGAVARWAGPSVRRSRTSCSSDFGSHRPGRRRRRGPAAARPRAADLPGRPPAGRSPAADRPRRRTRTTG